jgi:polyphosphate glucokinase
VKILVIDVGGSRVKILASGKRVHRKMNSGPRLTPRMMLDGVRELAQGWVWDRVSIGYPGVVRRNRPVKEPVNLGRGWVGFDYARGFGKPVRMLNDAAMQALGSYRGGSMLFLGLGTGLGTGLGSALVVHGEIQPLELGHLPYKKEGSFEDYVGKRGLERLGKKRWQRAVTDVIERLRDAMQPDYTVLGGGESKLLSTLPEGVERGDNRLAFRGGFLLWERDEPSSTRHRTRRAGGPPRRRRAVARRA